MSNPKIAAIGNFDGVHLGHRHLLAQVRENALRLGLSPMAVTFDTHPSHIFTPNAPTPALTTLPEKIRLLENEGMEHVEILPFTEALSHMESARFIEMLRAEYDVRALVIGYDNKLGSDRHHGFTHYRRSGSAIGVDVIQATPWPGGECSSSAIRRAITEGDLSRAAAMLGRPYSITGTVEAGRRIGRTIGFPTANVTPPQDQNLLIPPSGVYSASATDLSVPDTPTYRAVVNIGTRPTVNDDTSLTTIEAHLIGFEGDLYRHTLRVEFSRRLRPERKFDSLSELKEQIERDIRNIL